MIDLTEILAEHAKWLAGTGGRRANLTGADLTGANLHEANLYKSDLSWANLYKSDLSWANLSGANLSGADLHGAKIDDKTILEKLLKERSIVPAEGCFTAYKKVRNKKILTLEIPASAQRLGGIMGRKCRASSAKVVAGPDGETTWASRHDPEFTYTLGQTVEVKDFCTDPLQECAAGIHFFLTREEAEAY